ncbi:hydroxyethylthiazole kinase [Flavobacteriaceae bacterium Ap0902]|nr:hydroxyethylthiazole kinase [Flavobacteriaceae bacterium Ap0902]
MMHVNSQSILNKIRQQSPLVHNITNYVVMNNTANALLAIGASPVMAHSKEEVEDIVSISSSLVINMGTLSKPWVEAMLLTVKKAKKLNIPYVFDPVGIGASSYRITSAQDIIASAIPQVIRGNASEIAALAEVSHTSKGVDSTMASKDVISAAQELSENLNNTIVISGETDYVITKNQVTEITGGDILMSKVTGMGCTATGIIGACLAVETDAHLASCAAMEIMAEAGSLAAKVSNGPGSFQMHFIDKLYKIK